MLWSDSQLIVILAIVFNIGADAPPALAQSHPIRSETKHVVKPEPIMVEPAIHDIKVTTTCRNVPDRDVFSVANDRNNVETETALTRHGNDWTGSNSSIDFAKEPTSIRFDAQRSDCRTASPYRSDGVARFDFPVCEAAVPGVKIKTMPPTPFRYVRELTSGLDNSVPCKAGATFPEKGVIRSVQRSDEKVLLRIGPLKAYHSRKDADPEKLALLLFSANGSAAGVFALSDESGLIIEDPTLRSGATVTPARDGLRVKRGAIVQSLINKNKAKKALTDAELAMCEEAFGKLETVEVTVLK